VPAASPSGFREFQPVGFAVPVGETSDFWNAAGGKPRARVAPHPGSGDALSWLAGELGRWSARINLTAILDPIEMADKHILDPSASSGCSSPTTPRSSMRAPAQASLASAGHAPAGAGSDPGGRRGQEGRLPQARHRPTPAGSPRPGHASQDPGESGGGVTRPLRLPPCPGPSPNRPAGRPSPHPTSGQAGPSSSWPAARPTSSSCPDGPSPGAAAPPPADRAMGARS
jgi:hypothetical protein